MKRITLSVVVLCAACLAAPARAADRGRVEEALAQAKAWCVLPAGLELKAAKSWYAQATERRPQVIRSLKVAALGPAPEDWPRLELELSPRSLWAWRMDQWPVLAGLRMRILRLPVRSDWSGDEDRLARMLDAAPWQSPKAVLGDVWQEQNFFFVRFEGWSATGLPQVEHYLVRRSDQAVLVIGNAAAFNRMLETVRAIHPWHDREWLERMRAFLRLTQGLDSLWVDLSSLDAKACSRAAADPFRALGNDAPHQAEPVGQQERLESLWVWHPASGLLFKHIVRFDAQGRVLEHRAEQGERRLAPCPGFSPRDPDTRQHCPDADTKAETVRWQDFPRGPLDRAMAAWRKARKCSPLKEPPAREQMELWLPDAPEGLELISIERPVERRDYFALRPASDGSGRQILPLADCRAYNLLLKEAGMPGPKSAEQALRRFRRYMRGMRDRAEGPIPLDVIPGIQAASGRPSKLVEQWFAAHPELAFSVPAAEHSAGRWLVKYFGYVYPGHGSYDMPVGRLVQGLWMIDDAGQVVRHEEKVLHDFAVPVIRQLGVIKLIRLNESYCQ